MTLSSARPVRGKIEMATMDALSRIGPYEVIRKLGSGGMGEVYEARHTAIERRVAVKVLRAELAKNTEVNSRFINEARAVNIVDHPGIVQISDYGQLPDGTSYIVMEYLNGITLSNHLAYAQGKLPVEDALRFARQIGAVLAAAHGKGIIHRDLKPDNVMLVPDPDPEEPTRVRVKLLDFGVAKLSLGTQRVTAPGTRDMAVIGTPEYMSPEQCKDSSSVTDKSDVYSLGIILYEMLAGQVPFSSDSPTEVLAKHMYEPLPPIRTIAPSVPPTIAELVSLLLTKAVNKRPSMDDAIRLLDGAVRAIAPRQKNNSRPQLPVVLHQDGAAVPQQRKTIPSGSGPVSSGETAIRGRSRVAATVAAGLALLVVTGSAWFMLQNGGRGKSAATQASSVHWELTSEPSGALLTRVDTGAKLGTTPWQADFPKGTGALAVRLELTGYESRLVELSRVADTSRHEALNRMAPPVTIPTPPPTVGSGNETKAAVKPTPTEPAVAPKKEPAKKRRKHNAPQPEVEE